MRVLVTGAAGFIGHHLCLQLLERGASVLGVDNLNDYYDPTLKEARLARIPSDADFRFERCDIAAQDFLEKSGTYAPDAVVNLAAQAGVRYSLENPQAYIDANVVGFTNVLELCRHHKVKHLVYASSSSVYGGNVKQPFSVEDRVDSPVSLYAATKKANELMAHTYSHLFRVPTTGLRFFTVYGPWGRPDMALFLFTKAILEGRPINVFNHGDMLRDFTYIDDIVEGVVRAIDTPPSEQENHSITDAPYQLFNIGNSAPTPLMDMIGSLEKHLGRDAEKNFMPMQPGDVRSTHADVTRLAKLTGFQPSTPLHEGIGRFVDWYRDYYAR